MKKLLVLSAMALCAASVFADTAAFQFSIYSPGDLMIPWARSDVKGLRLDLPYGNNKGDVTGADIGLLGVTQGYFTGCAISLLNDVGGDVVDSGVVKGFQVGLLANRTKDLYGFQLGGIVNWNRERTVGAQFGLFNWDSEFEGLQLGCFNVMQGNVSGVQLGLGNVLRNETKGLIIGGVNYGVTKVAGAQIGAVNFVEKESTGVQIGVFNASQHHTGIQLGLLNINPNGLLPVFPFVNFCFR